jgi:hypothetical protein
MIASLILLAALIGWHYFRAVRGREPFMKPRPAWGFFVKIFYIVAVASIALCALTSFGAVLFSGKLLGWPLVFHMMGAGTFVFFLPVLALMWGRSSRFGQAYRPGRPERFNGLAKLSFWIMLYSGVVTIFTMLFSMLPIYGTDGLEVLTAIHRYSGLAVVLGAILHGYVVWLGRQGQA